MSSIVTDSRSDEKGPSGCPEASFSSRPGNQRYRKISGHQRFTIIRAKYAASDLKGQPGRTRKPPISVRSGAPHNGLAGMWRITPELLRDGLTLLSSSLGAAANMRKHAT